MFGLPTTTLIPPALVVPGGGVRHGLAGAARRHGCRSSSRGATWCSQLRTFANEPGRACGPDLLRGSTVQSPLARARASRVPAFEDARAAARAGRIDAGRLPDFLVLSVGLGVGARPRRADAARSIWSAAMVAAVFGAAAAVPVSSGASGTGGSTSSRSCCPRRSTSWAARSAPGTRCRPGFKMAADDGPEPVASEFRRVFEEQRFGLPLQDSCWAWPTGSGLVDVRILVTAILIQREVGGNLAEILDNLAGGDPGALHHPPPAQGLHRPGPDDRLPAGGAARSCCSALLYTLNPRVHVGAVHGPDRQAAGRGRARDLQLVGFLWIRKIVNIEI